MEYYQTRGFCEFYHCSHGNFCIPLRYVINKRCDCFPCIGGTVILSWMRTSWGLALVPLDALLACIVKCGKWKRQCIISITTLLCLMKCNPIVGLVNFFITTKCSAKMWSLISNLSVAVGMGFSNWPFVIWIWSMWRSLILKILDGAFCLLVSNSCWAFALT